METINWKELVDFIGENISYDATYIYQCERCGHAPKNSWIDHKESLVNRIAAKIGLKDISGIARIVEDVSATGNRKEDAEKIVFEINDQIMGITK